MADHSKTEHHTKTKHIGPSENRTCSVFEPPLYYTSLHNLAQAQSYKLNIICIPTKHCVTKFRNSELGIKEQPNSLKKGTVSQHLSYLLLLIILYLQYALDEHARMVSRCFPFRKDISTIMLKFASRNFSFFQIFRNCYFNF